MIQNKQKMVDKSKQIKIQRDNLEFIENINFQYQMSNSLQKLATKPTQFTRKKIENYSYGLNDVIGKGYSSQVYKGRNDNNDVPVAVKVIDLKMLKNQINRVLLESEIEILKELKNKPSILTLYDVFTTKNNTYLITELCSSDMNKIIKAKLTQPEACFYMAQLLDGYKEIHQHEIVHRDLKPANLLVTDSKTLKIADFGFGIKSKELAKPSKYNVGSPLYMAPESLKKNQYSYKTDLWSIGIIFFEMLTGDTPWRAKTEKQLIKKIESETISKILEKKKFSKMTEEFLIKILAFDKNYRMTPQELSRYNFRSQAEGNILTERVLNFHQRSTRFDSVLKSPNTSAFISPKHAFNQSIEKNFFQKQNSQKNIVVGHQNPHIVVKLRKQSSQTMKEINENTNPSIITDENKKNASNPEAVRPQDKKTVSKMLISIVHFCRFLYKLVNRMKDSESSGILKEIGYFELQGVYYSYTQTIKYMINLLTNFAKKDFLKLQTYQTYKESSDYTKLMKISNEYYERYFNELKSHWNTDEGDEGNNKFSSVQTTKLIKTMISYIEDIVNGMQDSQAEVQKLSKDIIIVDYLMTCKQLLEMFENGQEDYFNFAKKSRIEDIVEGSTSQITFALYKKILEKAKSFNINSMSPMRGQNTKKFNTVLNDCSNSFNQTSGPWGNFRVNNPLLQTLNR